MAVLAAMPVVYVGVALPPLLLRRLSEGPRDRPPGDLRLVTIGFAVACGFTFLALTRAASPDWDAELVGIAAAITGGAGMLYGQLVWLLFDRRQPRFGRFAMPTMLVFFALPATLFAFHDLVGLRLSRDAGQSFAFFVWTIPNYFYVPPLVLFVIAAVVSSMGRRRAERLEG